MQAAGIKMNAVAYRASNQQLQDLVGGQIRIACDNFSSAWEQVQAGKIRALAITSAKRYSFAPDIPTLAEMLKGFEVQAWFGWIAPIGVPKIILDKLTAEVNAVGQEPDVRKRLDTFTVEFSGLSGQAFADFARKERETLAPIIEKAPYSGGGFDLGAELLVCGLDGILAMASFEPAHDEVRPRHLLEVVDERVVHRCTTERADDRNGLRCELLRHHHAKAGCDLRNEPDQDRRAFREHPAFCDEARGLRDRFSEQPAGSKVPALRRIRLAIARPEGEHLQAGKGALRVREVFALAACDVPDRPQHDDGRDREFYRQRGETEAAAYCPRRRRQRFMQQARCGLGLLLHGAKRDRERCVERLGGGSGNRLGRCLGQRPAYQIDRLACDVAETGGQARMLERHCCRVQCVEVFFRHPDHYRHLFKHFSIAPLRNGPAPIKVFRC
jgi:hypothetical protein